MRHLSIIAVLGMSVVLITAGLALASNPPTPGTRTFNGPTPASVTGTPGVVAVSATLGKAGSQGSDGYIGASGWRERNDTFANHGGSRADPSECIRVIEIPLDSKPKKPHLKIMVDFCDDTCTIWDDTNNDGQVDPGEPIAPLAHTGTTPLP